MAKVLRVKANPDTEYGNNKIATLYAGGQLLTWVTGELIPATSSTTVLDGLSMEGITATDARYATAGSIQFDRLKETDELEMDVTGAIASFVKGEKYGLTDSQTVNLSDTTDGVLMFRRLGQNGRGVFIPTVRERATA